MIQAIRMIGTVPIVLKFFQNVEAAILSLKFIGPTIMIVCLYLHNAIKSVYLEISLLECSLQIWQCIIICILAFKRDSSTLCTCIFTLPRENVRKFDTGCIELIGTNYSGRVFFFQMKKLLFWVWNSLAWWGKKG